MSTWQGLRAVLVRFDGHVWACTMDGDAGLAMSIGLVDELQFAKAPKGSIADANLSKGFGVRPAVEGKPSLIVKSYQGMEVVKIGEIYIQQRFAMIVKHLFPTGRWFPPVVLERRSPVHVVVGDRTVAIIAPLTIGDADIACDEAADVLRARGSFF